MKANFFQPLNMHHFPFDTHKLAITLVSDEVCNITMAKLGTFAAQFKNNADELLLNSQWQLMCTPRGNRLSTTFEPTPENESATHKRYSCMSVRFCVTRKWQHIFYNFLLPVFLLSASALTHYLQLPSAMNMSGRLSINFALLLSTIALKLTTATMLPPVPYLTALDFYVLFMCIFIVGVATESAIRIFIVPNAMQIVIDESADADNLAIDLIAFKVAASIFIVVNFGCVAGAYYNYWFYHNKAIR